MPRLVYSIHFELEPTQSGTMLALIAPLSANGSSTFCSSGDDKRRVVDLRPGDWVYHPQGRFRIKAIIAYRQHQVDEAFLRDREKKTTGFVVY